MVLVIGVPLLLLAALLVELARPVLLLTGAVMLDRGDLALRGLARASQQRRVLLRHVYRVVVSGSGPWRRVLVHLDRGELLADALEERVVREGRADESVVKSARQRYGVARGCGGAAGAHASQDSVAAYSVQLRRES